MRAQEADHDDYGQSSVEFISERCKCAHVRDVHHIVDEVDERGVWAWVECDACAAAGEDCETGGAS